MVTINRLVLNTKKTTVASMLIKQQWKDKAQVKETKYLGVKVNDLLTGDHMWIPASFKMSLQVADVLPQSTLKQLYLIITYTLVWLLWLYMDSSNKVYEA